MNRIKDKKHKILSRNVDEAFEKLQHSFMKKTL
jgi:hypothetical protein